MRIIGSTNLRRADLTRFCREKAISIIARSNQETLHEKIPNLQAAFYQIIEQWHKGAKKK